MRMKRPLLSSFLVLTLFSAAALPATPAPAAEGEKAAEAAVKRSHDEIWRRFMDQHRVMLDFTDLDGSYIRPEPSDCRDMKPSALSWGVPVEDGALLNGLYLDALCTRWRLTGVEEARTKARQLVRGLTFLASVGTTPGFIARGVATDGKTTYPMGSNDQTMPWMYGVWRYLKDGLATPEERAELTQKFSSIVTVLDSHAWRMPTSGPPSPYRGSINRHDWESAPRLLFLLKAMHQLTGDAAWQQRYLEAAQQKGGKAMRTRLEICRTGMIFDPGQAERHSWTGSAGVVCLRGLWEMETDDELRAVYAAGLKASATLAAGSLPLCRKFDVSTAGQFEHNWRLMNEVWRPQSSEAEAVEVALAGLKIQHRTSPRMHAEKEYVREPCFAAWVVTLCPDRAFVEAQCTAILDVISAYPYEKLYLSQFFPVESAWWRLEELKRQK